MKFFRKPAPAAAQTESQASDTAPGVRMLKEVWHIEDEKKPREVLQKGSVSSDIYAMTPRSGPIPPRHRGRAES